MNVFEAAFQMLSGGTLEDKLVDLSLINDWSFNHQEKSIRFASPVRNKKIQFSKKQLKFPKKERLKTREGKVLALHFFANHELLAIEMMAQSLLLFPKMETVEAKKIVATIIDEQKHFKLYRNKILEWGSDFGDHPVNDFFWRQMASISTLDNFYAVVALTFEQANLDFALYYYDLFNELGEKDMAELFKVVCDDEVSHVARGGKYLRKKLSCEKELWDYYCEILPSPLTPSRAKGMVFNEDARIKAGLDTSFINNLKRYNDNFKVTQRKQWKA